MVRFDSPQPFGTAGGGGSSRTTTGDAIPFVITGPITFTPVYFPENFRARKSRELDRKQNFCKGEDVSDSGAKNWEIHVNGIMLQEAVAVFRDLAESGQTMDLSATGWSGEIYISDAEYEGPTGWDPQHDQWQFEYTIDAVATGAEREGIAPGDEDGIIESPADDDPTFNSVQGVR